MADPNRGTGQPKAHTKAGIMLENLVRQLLSEILPKSIREKTEYGAVICRNNHTSALSPTKLRHSTDSDNQLNVGLAEPNCGCPDNSTPVAYYHTHPFGDIDAGNGITLHASQDFSFPDDLRIANNAQLIAFLGSRDGKFRRYIPPKLPTTRVNGQDVPMASDAQGNLIPESFNDTTILNGKLPTR